ncbi:MAG: hypothetical protein ABUL73_04765 [Alphaproteobacteria bacterium]
MKLVRITLAALALSAAPLAAAIPTAQAETIIVHRGPPPLRHEVIIARPGPGRDWFWQPGYWRWTGNDYDWVGGRWEHRPHARAVWVSPHWAHRHRDWVFVEGHWR